MKLQRTGVDNIAGRFDPRATEAEGWGSASGYLIGLALTATVTLVGTVLFRSDPLTNVGLLYLVPVLVAATRYGLRIGVITGLVCSLTYNFFFIPPLHTLAIEDPGHVVTVLVLLGVAITSSQLAAQVRKQAKLARRSAAESRAMASFARQLTGVRTLEGLGELLCGEAAALFDAETVLLMRGDDSLVVKAAFHAEDRLQETDLLAARWALDSSQTTGHGSGVVNASEWLFQPIAAGSPPHAVLGLARKDAGAPLQPDELPLLRTLLDQAALAFERIALEDQMATVAQIKERDRLRTTLLSSISHDLRTPLTTVLGTLAEMRPTTAEQAAQLDAARGEAERLRRFVANLLDMVRIESGALHQSIEPVDLGEAVTSAVNDLRLTLAGHPVELEIAADLPLVLVDPQLFHHCLINLLENAAKYAPSGSPIAVCADRLASGLTLEVLDEGPGIPVGEQARIFETFMRIEGSDRKGGTGLGLAIVAGFAEAMGLKVQAANRSDKAGSCFTIHFDQSKLRAGEEAMS